MKKIIFALLVSVTLVQGEELKLFGKTVIYENGSWVNPEEPEFKITKPKTWLKRNYVRHYMQGSQELTDSIIKINFKEKFLPRRGRVNCSLNDNGKWRWFGTQFIIR